MNLDARSALAARLLQDPGVSAQVTERFFARHPDWSARYGALGRQRCTEDGHFHLSCLAGAVQVGRAETFVTYALWVADMLAARAIDRTHLVEYFDLLLEQLGLEGEEQRIVAEIIIAARTALLVPMARTALPAEDGLPLKQAYLSAALAGHSSAAWAVTRDALRQGMSMRQLYREVLIQGQLRLGELWAAAKITVAQEHIASAVTQSVIARLYPELPRERCYLGRAIMTGVEGELHGLPAQLASDLLEMEGWDVKYIGPHIPESSIQAIVEQERPDVLCLSATMPFSLPRTIGVACSLRQRFKTLRIVLGGRALAGVSGLAELGIEVDAAGDLSPLRPPA